jgi:hypothetical protein
VFEPCENCKKAFDWEVAAAAETDSAPKMTPGRYCAPCIERYEKAARAVLLEIAREWPDEVIWLEELRPAFAEKMGWGLDGRDRTRILRGLRAITIRKGDTVKRGFYTSGLTSELTRV